jgi:hypothetical protein
LSDSKKDLTRIEDLGEYLHELNEEDDTSELDSSDQLPDLPTEENTFADTSFESESFSSEEVSFEAQPEETATTFSDTEINFEPTENDQAFPETSFTPSEDSEVDGPEISFQDETFSPDPEPESELENEVEETRTPLSFDQDFNDPDEETTSDYRAPENFEDLRTFAEHTKNDGMGVEGNPSFSVLLRDIKYIEDVNDIILLLKELKLLSDSEDLVKQRLSRGHLLVPRISEYAAIFLAHKLRRFDIDILVGFSDEIHPPKHQESPETGLVSKNNLFQNQSHQFHFGHSKIDINQVILSSSSNLDGHQVLKYLGVATEHKMLDSLIVEEESSDEIPLHYSELANKLKAHALKANANAVIGLNYQLTPIPSDYGASVSKYRLSCTGNLVWVNKL